jgi:hypothetical protein
MQGLPSQGKSIFMNLPQGEPVTVVAIMVKDGKPHLAIQQTEVKADTMEGLTFEQVTIEELKERIKEIN